MTEDNGNTHQTPGPLDALSQRLDACATEIEALRREITRLKATAPQEIAEKKEEKEEREVVKVAQPAAIQIPLPKKRAAPVFPVAKSNLEKFIGENLINKIGIVITIIGVAIGAKYSIDNELISPAGRVILGYLAGIGLLITGLRLRARYESYSAVLVSGAIAILYIITYLAYSLYALMPQPAAFALMATFTAFTVVAAISYNRQIIAQIGLVGAYAVPFLLSDQSGNIAIFFTYITIINTGILFIAFQKYWKGLYYSAFGLTWLIFTAWFLGSYRANEHFSLSLIYTFIFFVTFYLVFLAYKLLKTEEFRRADILLLLANSFIFFGYGYYFISGNETGKHLLGLFTLFNALVHFGVGLLIYRRKLADKNLFYFVIGLVLVFITLAVPVQLRGNWIPLAWALEAALLFWIGRTRRVAMYETMSYPLMLLAFYSAANSGWAAYSYENMPAQSLVFANVSFLSSLVFIAAFGYILWLKTNPRYPEQKISPAGTYEFMSFAIPTILLISIYLTFRQEIVLYWDQQYADSAIEIPDAETSFVNTIENYDMIKFRDIWLLNYSFLFLVALAWINIRRLQQPGLATATMSLISVVLLAFLILGLYLLGGLTESFFQAEQSLYYPKNPFIIPLRYLSFGFASVAMAFLFVLHRQDFTKPSPRNLYILLDLGLNLFLLWIISSELIMWMNISALSQSDKLGLSILWGVYALIMVSWGIWKNIKHLRVAAIALFAVTLVKLFLYDISQMSMIAKTIIFVSLGVLLLIISFLYTKYKHLIFEEDEN